MSKTTKGIGFFGMLTILFIGLKLTNYVDWSWWWVFSPIWAPIVIGIMIGIIVIVAVRIIYLTTHKKT